MTTPASPAGGCCTPAQPTYRALRSALSPGTCTWPAGTRRRRRAHWRAAEQARAVYANAEAVDHLVPPWLSATPTARRS